MKYCHQCRKNTNTVTDYDDINDEQYDDCCPTCGADLSNSEFKLLEPTTPVVIKESKRRSWLTREEYLKKEAEHNAKEDAWIEGMLARQAEQGIIIIESLNIKS